MKNINIEEIRKNNREFENQLRKPTGTKGIVVADFLRSHNFFQNRWSISLLKLKPTDTVLEIGFGTGEGLKMIANKVRFGKIWGLDFSKLMVETAKKLNAERVKSKKLELLSGEVSKYNFKQLKFDKILGVNVLYFWKKPQTVMSKLFRLLNPGGRLALFIYDKESQKDRESEGIFRNYSGEAVCKMLKDSGFQNVSFNTRTFGNNPRLGVCVVAEK